MITIDVQHIQIDILDQEGETDYSMAWDCIANSLYFNYASFTGMQLGFVVLFSSPPTLSSSSIVLSLFVRCSFFIYEFLPLSPLLFTN